MCHLYVVVDICYIPQPRCLPFGGIYLASTALPLPWKAAQCAWEIYTGRLAAYILVEYE